MFHRLGGVVVPIRQGKKDSGCIYAGDSKADSRFLSFFFIVSGTDFPARGEKDPGTVYETMGDRADQWYWLLFCHIGCTLDVEAS